MRYKPGTKVVAIKRSTSTEIILYGKGEYIGDKIPNTPSFIRNKLENPCIKLDDGTYVWGFQCWWGDIEGYESSKYSKLKEIIEPLEKQEIIDIYNG